MTTLEGLRGYFGERQVIPKLPFFKIAFFFSFFIFSFFFPQIFHFLLTKKLPIWSYERFFAKKSIVHKSFKG